MAEPKLNVFIIDDNDMTRTVLRMIIQGDVFSVVGDAASAKSALERVFKLRPDIICLDIVMPDRDGLDLIEEIKRRLPRTKILMVTASNDQDTVQTAIRRGAVGYILKPFNAGTVMDTLHKAAADIRGTHNASQ